jgi:hypothetical protein
VRQKDAEMVATILGNELRTCSPDEYAGMEHAHPEFDRAAYLLAVEAPHRPSIIRTTEA